MQPEFRQALSPAQAMALQRKIPHPRHSNHAPWTALTWGFLAIIPVILLAWTALLATTLYALPATGQEKPSSQYAGYWSIQIENDMLTRDNHDRFYTHGTEVSFTKPGRLAPLLANLAGWVPFFERTPETAISYAIGQKVFTPEKKLVPQLILNDRPYVGYSYISALVGSRLRSEDFLIVANAVELTLGVVGPASYAGDTQRALHKALGLEVPMGWDNQLRNELGFVLNYTRKWRYLTSSRGPVEFEFGPHVGGNVGNIYTAAAAGIVIRMGSGLRNDVAPPLIRPGFPGSSYFAPTSETNWYLYAGMEGRVVARDIFLDGNTFVKSHHVNKKPLVGDFQIGFAIILQNIRIALVNVLRTKEFEQQSTPQSYGAINISYHSR